MNILFVNPALRPEARVRYFPIGAGFIVSALARAGYAVDLADMDAHRLDEAQVIALAEKGRYDIVLLGAIVTGYPIVKNLARALRQVLPKALLVAGNSVASSIPEHLLLHTDIDIAVLGEGEVTVVELVQALERGESLATVPGLAWRDGDTVRKSDKRHPIKDISAIPRIDYSLFDTESYITASRYAVLEPYPRPLEEVRAFAVNTARGCIADCTFCYHVFKGEGYRYREEAVIIDEISYLATSHGVNYIFFNDDLSLYSKSRAQNLASGILQSGLQFDWLGTCRANLFNSREDLPLLRDLKASGCIGLGYSLENADPGILKAMNKHITPEDFVRQAGLLEEAGLSNYTSLVLGYPQETEATIAKTFDVCIQARVCPSAGYLLPLPGSVMYDYCLSQGIITHQEEYLLRLGDRQDLRINLTTMPDETFTACVQYHIARLNSALGITSQGSDLIKNERYKVHAAEVSSPQAPTSTAPGDKP